MSFQNTFPKNVQKRKPRVVPSSLFPSSPPPTSSVSTCSMCTTCHRAATARAWATACAASPTTAGARCWASPWPLAPPSYASARRKRRSAPASAWRTRTCSAGASPSPSQLRPLRGTTRPHHPPHLRLHLRFQFNLFPPPLFPSFPWRSRAPLGGKGVRGVSVRERGNPRSPSPFRCLRGPTAPGGGAGGDLTPFPPKPEPFLRSAASCRPPPHPACRLSSPNLVHVLHSACANLWLLNYSHASSHASCSLMPGLFLCFVQHFM